MSWSPRYASASLPAISGRSSPASIVVKSARGTPYSYCWYAGAGGIGIPPCNASSGRMVSPSMHHSESRSDPSSPCRCPVPFFGHMYRDRASMDRTCSIMADSHDVKSK